MQIPELFTACPVEILDGAVKIETKQLPGFGSRFVEIPVTNPGSESFNDVIGKPIEIEKYDYQGNEFFRPLES